MQTPTDRPRRLSLAVVACAVLTSGTACAVHPNDHTLPGQVAVGDDGYTVEVTFAKVENLVPNSTVLHDDVIVGTVTDIEVDGWQAVVTMRLLDDVPISADAEFSIGQKTLLGAQYVEVSSPPGGGELLADGDEVPVDQTGTYPATEQVLGAASLLLNNGGLSQISTITKELNRTLDGRVPDARSLMTTLNKLLATLDDNKDHIIGTLAAVDHLSSRIREDSDVVAEAIDRLGPALRVLNRQRERLVAAVTTSGATSADAVRAIGMTRQALLDNLANLRPTVRRLSTVAGLIPESLEYLVSLPFPIKTTQRALRGDYANLFTTLDLSVPDLAEAFLGISPGSQAVDPTTAPLDVIDDEPTRHGDGDRPADDSGAPHADVPGDTPDELPCTALAKLLGAC